MREAWVRDRIRRHELELDALILESVYPAGARAGLPGSGRPRRRARTRADRE
jgi:hypothetical protein